jgi:hypothetical protein
MVSPRPQSAHWQPEPARSRAHEDATRERTTSAITREDTRMPSRRSAMLSVRSAVGAAAIGLVTLASPASAASFSAPQPATSGNLSQPSMIEDGTGFQHVVARGDTGLWYVTNTGGSMVRTRLTRDFDTRANGHLFHHAAVDPLIAINARGVLTVVYGVTIPTDGGCAPSQGLRYIVRQGGAWSKAKRIPDTTCHYATGLLVHGATISLAVIRAGGNGASAVSYVTNASGSWTRVTVASGLRTGTRIGPASLAMYDGKPMLAYTRKGHLVYARGLSRIGNFVRETAAATDPAASSKPSLAINPLTGRQMIAWAQADGTHYAYRNAHGWYSHRVMQGSVRALLTFDTGGNPYIAAADGAGGLWYADRLAGSWHPAHLDAHGVSDLGGIGLSDHIEITYLRENSRLFWVASASGC